MSSQQSNKTFGYQLDDGQVSTSLKHMKRVYDEIEDMNADFHNLRTVMRPDPEDHINLFYFVMLPNDGSMAHQPLVGRMYLPPNYPTDPPVIHLFTRTGRYNVDVYRNYIETPQHMHSSLCFDILRSKSNSGTWEPQYTISCLFASLMQAVVSYLVPQEYGQDRQEFVKMETLESQRKAICETYVKWSKLAPDIPSIPLIEAIEIPARQLVFPHPVTSNDVYDRNPRIYTSDEFYLQTNDVKNNVTFDIDLSNLSNNPHVVFSVILSNEKTGRDLVGRKQETVLVRNGVTASSAKKKVGWNKAKWFYHGIPLNQNNLKLNVTVANNQFVMSYIDKDGCRVIHGDTPVSQLDIKSIGDVKNVPFYMHIFLKRKRGDPITLTILKSKNGYIHPGVNNVMRYDEIKEEKSDIVTLDHPPVYVSGQLSGIDTHKLFERLCKDMMRTTKNQKIVDNYNVKFGMNKPAHVTLAFYKDKPNHDEWKEFVIGNYLPIQGNKFDLDIVGFAMDSNCVALMVRIPADIPFLPADKNLHLTMMLSGNTKPVYSNHLITTLKAKKDDDILENEFLAMYPDPIRYSATVKFVGKLRDKKKNN